MIQSYLLLLTAAFNVIIALAVWRRSRMTLPTVMFLGSAFGLVGWAVGDAFLVSLTSDAVGDLARILFLVSPLAVVSFLILFALLFPKEAKLPTKWAVAAFVPAILAGIIISLAPQLFIGQINVHSEGPNTFVVGHPYYELYAVLISTYFVTAYTIFLLRLRRMRGLAHIQTQYAFAGVIISSAPACFTNLALPILGITGFVWIGPLFTVVYIVFYTIAIARYRLFDIRVTAVRTLAYLLTLSVIVIVYVTVIALVRVPLGQLLGLAASQQEVFYVAMTVLSVFLFGPLRAWFDNATMRIFFRQGYNSQAVLNNFSKILVSELHLDRILKKSLTELCENLHIQFGQLVVFNHDRVYRIEHYGPLPRRLMIAPELAKLDRPILIADELEGGERKGLMDRHGIRVSLTLRTREEFVGYLLLGDKLSGDIYSSQDIELLEIIAKELAVAILNAKAYAEIQDFNLTLQARIDRATNRLRVANRHLKELDRAKDEFISMASHQLRTPLTTIKGYLSMMLEGDAGHISAQQKDFVGYAFSSSQRMVNLISDLLNVSRLSAGRFLIQTKPTDMVQMIADEVRQLETHAAAKHIKLIFDRPPQALPPAQIDDNKTRQVVMNFIDNAIYYTPSGEVRVILKQTGDRVHLEVRDTGIGVPENARKKLFTKFYRADNAQVVRPDGTGLGLYLAKRVIQDQGGTIIFSSVEGKGSTFGFELPFKPQPPKHDPKAKHEEAHARSKSH